MRLLYAFLFITSTLSAQINIAVSYPYIGALVKSVGGENVTVNVLAKGSWDPHFVVPKPSLIATLRNADVLIINGAQLEIGWIPPLLKRANNRNITPSSEGFLDLSSHVSLIHKPLDVSRSGGDVHPDGNPHFHLDPQNIATLADAITNFLSQKYPKNAAEFHANNTKFQEMWKQKMQQWLQLMRAHKDASVIQYHKVFDYFLKAYSLNSAGTIEPLPGIAPSSQHTLELIKVIQDKKPLCIMHDVYHATKTAQYIAQKSGIKLVILPHDIGAMNDIDDLAGLFEYLIKALQ